MDELHYEMTILRSSLSDRKDRSEGSSSENSEIATVLSSRMMESEYERCNSDMTSSSDDKNDCSAGSRRTWKSLSRTDSGVSLNTNKEEFPGKSLRSYLRKSKSKENQSHSII